MGAQIYREVNKQSARRKNYQRHDEQGSIWSCWGSRGNALREGGELGDKFIKSEKAMSVRQ